ncbi:DMT family transporter [Roseateles violae]|uniref:DMT family transporter n=1 Tax=Roseateles violae TaxID=3058042 RepID=A0ABT8DWG7_9BURK|nr:DMT family transporter [Pelomonas sp. PFR6]MDN3920732.1 DMT family transporter [Pelomonas sp. PFR6]
MQKNRPGLGILLVLLMVSCFASMDSTIRYLGAFVPVLLILWARYAFQALTMAIWLGLKQLRGGTGAFRSAHPKFQLLRGALLLATSAMSFYGVQQMPVAEFTAINMLTPVLVTLLAALVLHERVRPLRWALVVGGFAGALIVIRPGSGLFGWAVLFPLAGALFYACFQTLTSSLSALENPYTTHFYTGLTGAALLTLALALGPYRPLQLLTAAPAWQLGLLAFIGLLGTAGHLFLILALGMAPTGTLMPFVYVQIAVAAAIGWVAFDHAPDGYAWLGMAVLSASGAASAWLNVREAQARNSVVLQDTIED